MATKWTFRQSKLTECGPELLFRLNGTVVFTRDFVRHNLLSKKHLWRRERVPSLRAFIKALWVESRTWTSAYRKVHSYGKCPSITSGPSLASIRSLVLHLGRCTCGLIGRQPV
jgi:hypothetical protein